MKQGDVVLTPVAQADGKVKNRPAIVLREMPPFQDLLVCGISTQIQHQVKGFDEVIAPGDQDFRASGLVTTSLIRLGFLALLPQQRIVGTIGAISHERYERLLRNLSAYLVKELSTPAKS
jgi:mRNA interferase MazF